MGSVNERGQRAQAMAKEYENVLLDGTYTAKAFSALVDYSKRCSKSEVILFWNTYDSHFSLSEQILDYKELPLCFHHYFESAVQPLDNSLTRIAAPQ
jgi:hypothetical protein